MLHTIANFLRRLRYLLRLAATGLVVSPHRAELNRLIRAGRVEIGEHSRSYAVPTVVTFMHDDTRLTIGDYCSLSADAKIYLGGRHSLTSVTTYPHRILFRMPGAGEDGFPTPTGDTFIGSDVWLCPGAQVLSGVRIGHGAIIGAGSVVTKDVPDFGIVGGNPAKLIRHRFNEEQREALLEIAWWDWPEDEVRRAVPLLAGEDIDEFIAYARERFPHGDAGADQSERRTRTT
ncbi:CatB-related O-acetyltransferase [Nocardioides terrisoli]|uniref:CatB-related O-acetyltransferase n=1 Tax=Nocardioides terrisoli TaxID=3388267 RepID=UPI00287BC29E|nr:CatB-related O-acetyltransferase [Nocardioides marmorisolisilvae]